MRGWLIALPKVLLFMRALMTSRRLSHVVLVSAVALLVSTLLPAACLGQGLVAEALIPNAPSAVASAAVSPAPIVIVQSPRSEVTHTFWDKQNTFLFAAVTGLNAADFAVTRANLQSGGKEMNPIVRMFGNSTAGLAVNFAGETAGVMGISYFFHRTGHHKLERAVSYLNIGSSAGAVSYGLAHR
jgi:hypothetical protein